MAISNKPFPPEVPVSNNELTIGYSHVIDNQAETRHFQIGEPPAEVSIPDRVYDFRSKLIVARVNEWIDHLRYSGLLPNDADFCCYIYDKMVDALIESSDSDVDLFNSTVACMLEV